MVQLINSQVYSRLLKKIPQQFFIILVVATVLYFPFVNQALHIDSDMFMHVTNQLLINPSHPPLGDYGRHMVLHDHTNMPVSSVYYRCAHPPLLPLLFTPIALLCGNTEWPYHVAMFIFYLIAIWGPWYFFGLFVKQKQRFYATLVWAACPALVVNSHTLMWDVPLTGIMVLAFSLGIKGCRNTNAKLIVFSAIITGLGALVKTNIIPLYAVIPGLLLWNKKWKLCIIWLCIASAIPLVWVVHNSIVFGKIQYLSMGLFHPIIGDVRYRLERTVSFLGACITLPVFWYWLMVQKTQKKRWVIIAGIIISVWGYLLLLMLHKPVWFAIAYAAFAWPGLWMLFRGLGFGGKVFDENIDKKESVALVGYVVFYIFLTMSFPTASVRYMLPMIPVFVLLFVVFLQTLSNKQRKFFEIVNVVTVIVISLLLSIADYLYCEADRKLPKALLQKGYMPTQTWYFGRMSYDYYLYNAGYKNIRTENKSPVRGEFLIEESIPGDYKAVKFLPQHFDIICKDTLSFYYFPVRTLGGWAGFYGSDRLAYWFNSKLPQRQYLVYRIVDK